MGLQAGGGDGRLDGSRPPPFKIGPNDFGAVLRSNSRLPHLRGEFGGDRVRRGFKRIGRDVGIAACGLGTLVSQQFTDDREPEIAAGTGRGEGMPQIVQPYRTQCGTMADGLPGPLQIVPGVFGPQASDNVVAGARNAFKHRNGRTGKNDRLAAGLAVGEQQHAAFAIEFLPAQV